MTNGTKSRTAGYIQQLVKGIGHLSYTAHNRLVCFDCILFTLTTITIIGNKKSYRWQTGLCQTLPWLPFVPRSLSTSPWSCHLIHQVLAFLEHIGGRNVYHVLSLRSQQNQTFARKQQEIQVINVFIRIAQTPRTDNKWPWAAQLYTTNYTLLLETVLIV